MIETEERTGHGFAHCPHCDTLFMNVRASRLAHECSFGDGFRLEKPVRRMLDSHWARKTVTLLCLLFAGCGGLVEHDPPGITRVGCWVECLRLDDRAPECVTITDPKQFEEAYWLHVTDVEWSGGCDEWTPSTR